MKTILLEKRIAAARTIQAGVEEVPEWADENTPANCIQVMKSDIVTSYFSVRTLIQIASYYPHYPRSASIPESGRHL